MTGFFIVVGYCSGSSWAARASPQLRIRKFTSGWACPLMRHSAKDATSIVQDGALPGGRKLRRISVQVHINVYRLVIAQNPQDNLLAGKSRELVFLKTGNINYIFAIDL